MTRNVVAGLIVAMVVLGFGLVASDLPRFGDPTVPAHNEIYQHYVDAVKRDTGALNSVTAVVFDYRGYDTLGEATVLFAAATASAAVLMGRLPGGRRRQTGSRAAAQPADATSATSAIDGSGVRGEDTARG